MPFSLQERGSNTTHSGVHATAVYQGATDRAGLVPMAMGLTLFDTWSLPQWVSDTRALQKGARGSPVKLTLTRKLLWSLIAYVLQVKPTHPYLEAQGLKIPPSHAGPMHLVPPENPGVLDSIRSGVSHAQSNPTWVQGARPKVPLPGVTGA